MLNISFEKTGFKEGVKHTVSIGLDSIKSFKNMVQIKILQYSNLHWVGDILRKPFLP